jgi:adenylylsulfate kinase
LFKDLSFTREDRFENIRRLGFIANKFSDHGIITLVSAINPYEEIRRELTETYKDVKVVHVDCPLEELVKRDTKGLYKRAMLPEDHPNKLKNLTGYNDPFETPENPDLYINTKKASIAGSTDLLCAFIIDNLDTVSTNKSITKELIHA